MMVRNVILYIATSLDGYIAKPDDDLDFLSIVAEEGEDYGYADFYKSVDTVILGRKTYDWVMTQVSTFPHEGKTSFVITRTAKAGSDMLTFYNGDLKELVLRLKGESGGNIFIDGGAQIVNELLREDLIDEFVISIVPVLVGGGTRLFEDGRPEQILELVSTKQFKKGLTQFHYKRTAAEDFPNNPH